MTVRGFNLPSELKSLTKIRVTFQECGKPLCQLMTKISCLDGKTEAESKVRRATFGEKNPNKPTKTILLVGETGTGKTSLTDALVNYVKGIQYEDEVRLCIVEEQRTSQSKSCTSAVTVYDIFTDEDSSFPFNITIIDTPGYGDTRGLEYDQAVARMLLDLFRSNDGIHEINTVGFVMKASENHLTDRQRYIFDAVLSLFGKDIENNIVPLITHSDGGSASNVIQALKDAKIPCAKDEKGNPVHFLFNNRKTEVTTEKKKDKEEKAYMYAWGITMDAMDELFKFLKEVQPQQLAMTVDVLNSRIQTEALMTNYQEQIKYIEIKQAEQRQVEEALKKQKEACSVTVDEPFKEKVPIDAWWDNKAVCCTVCEETCHYPGCTMSPTLWLCEVIKKDHCTSCTGRCHYTKHVKENWRFVSQTRRVTKKYEDLLKEYMNEKDRSEMAEKEKLLAAVQRSIEEAGVKKNQLVEDSYQNVLKLQEIALQNGSLSTYLQLDFLIQNLNETEEPDKYQKVQKLKNIKEQIGKQGRD